MGHRVTASGRFVVSGNGSGTKRTTVGDEALPPTTSPGKSWEIAYADKGLVTKDVKSVSTVHGFTKPEIDRLVIPARTLRHREEKNQPLTLDESDRVLRLDRIATLAEETFGDKDKAHAWLRRPNKRFDGHPPLDLLRTEVGGRAVEDLLMELQLGFPA